MAHYPSKEQAFKNRHSLNVGDTFNTGHLCDQCGTELIGFYSASITFDTLRHTVGQCLTNLLNRIKLLEERSEL
jgi:hypothetical protein